MEMLDGSELLIVEQSACVISTINVFTDSGLIVQEVIHSRMAGFNTEEPALQLDFMLSPNRARRYVSQLIQALRDFDMAKAKQNPPAPED
jgi:hypothetical protein